MPKARSQKTRKAVAKRFKFTATGKIKRARKGKRHLLQCKSPKRRRRLGTTTIVDKTCEKRIKLCLPFR